MNPNSFESATLDSLRKLYAYYKNLGEKAMAQVSDDMLFWQPSPEGNSIAILVKHLAGNMHSRFTDFLTTDGEKPSRNRDGEFEIDAIGREDLNDIWEKGWKIVLDTLGNLGPQDMGSTVYIRNEGHLVVEALHRQLGHYAYHVGQMVLLARTIAGDDWTSLSIPKGQSKQFNEKMFGQEKQQRHFTDGMDSKN